MPLDPDFWCKSCRSWQLDRADESLCVDCYNAMEWDCYVRDRDEFLDVEALCP